VAQKRICRLIKFPYIFIIDEASDFKFGIQLGFVKACHNITPTGKSGRSPGLGELLKTWGSPVMFLQQLNLVDTQLGLAKAHHKITHTGKK